MNSQPDLINQRLNQLVTTSERQLESVAALGGQVDQTNQAMGEKQFGT